MSDEAVNTITSEAAEAGSLVTLLSEDLVSNPSLKDFKDVNALAKSYVHLKSKMGTALFKPAPDASEDETRAFKEKLKEIPGVLFEPSSEQDAESLLTKLGKPASASEYQFQYPNEDVMNSGIGASIAEEAFNLGLTQKQAQRLLDKTLAAKSKSAADVQAKEQETVSALKAKWGEAYEERMSSARHALELIKESFPSSAEEIASSKNPAVIAMLAEMGNKAQEKSVMGSVKDSAFYKTPDYAKQQIAALKQDPEFMSKYMNGFHPEHAKAMETMTKLHMQMTGAN